MDFHRRLLASDDAIANITGSPTSGHVQRSVLNWQRLVLIVIYILPSVHQLGLAGWTDYIAVGSSSPSLQLLAWRYIVPHLMSSLRIAQLIVYLRWLIARIRFANRCVRAQLQRTRHAPPEHGQQMRRQLQRRLVTFGQLYEQHSTMLRRLGDCFGWTVLFGLCHDFVNIGTSVFVHTFREMSYEMAFETMLAPVCNLLGLTVCGHLAVDAVS